MPRVERVALRRSHQAQQRAPAGAPVGAVTALSRLAPRRSERDWREATYTRRFVGDRLVLLENRGARRRDKLGRYLIIGLIAAALIGGLISAAVSASREFSCSTSPERQTRWMMAQLAYEAVPQLLAAHPERRCPALAELVPYTNRDDARDGWGTPLELYCAPAPSLAVMLRSAGPDRELGTDDDLVGP